MQEMGDSIKEPDTERMSPQDDNNARDTWSKKMDCFLSMVGYCVGVENIWRFPYVCMRNGGGAFLIPFLLALIICGFPLYFLELSLGQFHGQSAWHVWNICPLLRGIGLSMNILCAAVSWYYSIGLAWSLLYMVNAFKSPLPWMQCGQSWNTNHCVDASQFRSLNDTIAVNSTLTLTDVMNSTLTDMMNSTLTLTDVVNSTLTLADVMTLADVVNSTVIDPAILKSSSTFSLTNYSSSDSTVLLANGKGDWNGAVTVMSSTEEFWQHNILQLSSGLGDLGGIVWQNALAMTVANIAVTLALIKGVSSSGKVVYVTATLPYILLGVILVMGCTLPGAGDGILFYIKPEFGKLLKFQTWIEAAIQMFYSLGPCWGGLPTMASYSKFNNNCLRDAILLVLLCEGTSVFGGFAIFSVLGHMAYRASVPITKFATSGAGLAFIVYPEAISYLPVPQFWGFLIFLMFFILGLDTQFASVETVITTICDLWPALLRRWRTPVTVIVMVIATLAGLLFTSRAGGYWFQLMDWYMGAFILIQAVLECVAVAWCYGSDRFCYDIQLMIGRRPPRIVVLLWKFICPTVLLVLFFITLAFYEPPIFAGYTYPEYARGIGWFIGVLPFVGIVANAAVVLWTSKGSLRQRLRTSIAPPDDWAPCSPYARQLYRYTAVNGHDKECDFILKQV